MYNTIRPEARSGLDLVTRLRPLVGEWVGGSRVHRTALAGDNAHPTEDVADELALRSTVRPNSKPASTSSSPTAPGARRRPGRGPGPSGRRRGAARRRAGGARVGCRWGHPLAVAGVPAPAPGVGVGCRFVAHAGAHVVHPARRHCSRRSPGRSRNWSKGSTSRPFGCTTAGTPGRPWRCRPAYIPRWCRNASVTPTWASP